MDELLHHCLRELAFDGDLGCDVSRLSDFIKDFYAHSLSNSHQKVDDALCAFVWSLVVQQPTVLVGTIPPEITSQVWIAPQVSAKRKASARGEEHVTTEPPALDLISDAKSRPLADLQREYGNRLRIAGDRDSIYAAITGTHIRFPKMSPMVYTALQIITRGREDGVTVVQLGAQSKYDQKSCFYLVKQLTDLNLVVKVRRGGVGTHFVIHRYFFDRSPSWKAIRDEETRAELASQNIDPPPIEDDDESADVPSLGFTPIDSRHLSSLPLVRGRVVKLLKASTNNMHVSNNMLVTIGFANPTKTDRRFFQRRIHELIQQGVLEKVVVPSKKKKTKVATVLCLRLLDETSPASEVDGVVVVPPTVENEDDAPGGFKLNVTVHKQISDLLEESGTTGMTLADLANSLSQFDKRTIELILTRAERFQPPSHLSDLGVAALLENSGRERRHRYFTVSAYRTLVDRENLDKSTAGYGDVNVDNAGGFLNLDPAGFYADEEELQRYQDSFKEDAPSTLAKAKKPPKAPKQKRSKKQVVDADGNAVAESSKKRSRKRKAEESDVADGMAAGEGAEPIDTRPPKRRKKKAEKAAAPEAEEKDVDDVGKESAAPSETAPPKRARGRPRKNPAPPSAPPGPPKKRGRPRKSKPEDAEDEGDDSDKPPPKKRGRKSKAVVNDSDDDEYDGEPEPEVNLRRSTRTRTRRISFNVLDEEEDQLNDDDQGGEGEAAVTVPPQPQAAAGSPPPATLDENITQSNDGVMESVEVIQSSIDDGSAPEAGPSNGYEDFSSTRIQEPESASLAGPSDVQEDPSSTQIQEPLENSDLMSISTAPPQPAPAPEPEPEPSATTLPRQETAAVPRSTALPRPKVNVSNLRRENELLRVVESLGGIVNTHTKELYETHGALLETLAKAGEPASSPPGTRTDKRTVTATFNSLESRGKVRQLTTSVPMYLGTSRPTVIVYLPHVTDAQLSAFLTELAQSAYPPPLPQPSGRLIEEPIEYGQEPRMAVKKAPQVRNVQAGVDGPERWGKNPERAEQLFASEDSTIREVLLTERTTLCQLYRTIIAKCLRARALHLIAIHAFETAHPSPQIVSHEQNIIHLSFLSLDLPLEQYSQLVSPVAHSEELCEFIATPEGLNTIVRDLPENIKNIIHFGKARASSKLLDSLELLRSLHLVTPLVPSASDVPLITCAAKDTHPTAFDAAPLDGWTSHTPLSAPTYWKFNEIAPLHHWAASETNPPSLGDFPVGSVALANAYWTALENACLNQSVQYPPQERSTAAPPKANVAAARTLRRRVSWNARYKLSWHQTQYLKRFYDVITGMNPAEGPNSEAQITNISWVISAPANVVRDYYADMQRKLNKEADRARKRLKDEAVEKQAMETHQAKASLKKKAEDAHRQRDEEWTQLLERVHPEPLKQSASLRVKRIHGRFLQSTSVHDAKKWEGEILNAVREAELISKKVLKTGKDAATFTLPKRPIAPIATVAPPVAVNPPERSVAELIAEQGPPITQTRPPTKKQRKKKGAAEAQPDGTENKPRPPTQRRHRFMWTREYEELARDASAIIKARCRDIPRLDWGAFEQVFPAVPRNTVRQRVAHLREATGGETYLNRLEDSWYHLWIQHRGSAHLPDENPLSPINFDLVQHVEFLRKHIDKNALRVGYMPNQHSTQPAILDSVSSLLEKFDVIESPPNAPSWDFVWNALVEEGREKGLLSLPFTSQVDLLSLEESSAEDMCLAEAAVKMVLGTPSEVYEAGAAEALLNSVGEEAVPVAAQNLLGRGVLSKLVRDPQKSQPGRLLKISEINQNALNGVINRDIFQDAAALDEQAVQQDDDVWREWPLLATDGDLASLLQLVSENKVEFNIDTSHPQSCRPALDWNSKKADDDQIETSINFRFIDLSDTTSTSDDAQDSTAAMTVDERPVNNHGLTVDGLPACCRKNIVGAVVDCPGCLDELWSAHSSQFNVQELEIAQLILWLGGQTGPKGMTKEDLIVNTKMELQDVLPVIFKMTGEQHPFLYWVGYNSTLLVSAAFARSWTVTLSSSPVLRVFPRRWLDIFGKKVLDVWEAALRAVVGAIVSRPGISQTELRWRLKSVYDKQEVADLLKTLLEENFIKNRFVSSSLAMGAVESHAICALDEREEGCVFWFVNEEKHWYSI